MSLDLSTIDALAQLHLVARRLGLELRLYQPSQEMRELLAFTGLDDVLRVQPDGQAEERKQRLGAEEERELGDPAA
jgi:anti-anti-sigma regulatory factor